MQNGYGMEFSNEAALEPLVWQNLSEASGFTHQARRVLGMAFHASFVSFNLAALCTQATIFCQARW